ncbi:hypothetical protein F4782DRAFT_531208 [Xylaria castorea]|nr:hypothetical protein F4782DRAFT_531208 [Xylaria castorea]
MGKKKHSTYYQVIDGQAVEVATVEPDEHGERHRKHKKHSSSSGHTREDYHHSSRSYSSRHEYSHPTHRGDGGSRGHPDLIPRPSPANYYPNPNVTMGYTNSQHFGPAASFDNQQYQYRQGPLRVYRHEVEEVSYITPRPDYYEGSRGPSSAAYFPSERTSTWGTGYENGEANYSTSHQPPPDNALNEPAYNVPFPIQEAIAKGEEAMPTLKETIRVVLLYEWCMEGNEVYPPSKDFKIAIKVIPVRRDKYGAYQPIESKGEGQWGVKTGYYPEYDTYLSTILIRVPSELYDVNEAKVKAAYKRFFAEARIDLLEDVLELPFKNDKDCRKYGMLFTFGKGSKRGSKPPRLFDDYLCEDAMIRL